MSTETCGIYELSGLIGSGSFADVHLGFHPGLQTRVAVKVLHPHLARDEAIRERFIQEAQVLWRADSDRVIQVTHVDELPDGRPYLVMRFADRGTLNDMLRERIGERGTLFSLRESIGLAVDLVDCLNAIRDRNLVHRDLKPANILVKTIRTPDHRRAELFGLPADERLVLADFGLAKRLQEGTNFASQLGGTPAYMAPELASLTAEVTWRADLFSAAVILYEIATGAIPWPQRALASVGDVDLDEVRVRDWRPEFPASMDDVLHRALAVDPLDRHDSPDDFAAELKALLDTRPMARATRGGDTARGVRNWCEGVLGQGLLPDGAAQVLTDELERPVRIGVIGGNRLSPVPLGLKLVGERPPPGEVSLLGSVVVRLRDGEPRLIAATAGGERLVGEWRKDADAFIHLALPAPAWSIRELEIHLPQPDIEALEIIDVPHSVMRRDPEQVREVYESLDIVVIGLPTGADASAAAIDEVLSLSSTGGPFAAVGVRQLGVTAGGDHPVIAGTVPGDDTIEFRVLLDELLAGDRIDECRVSSAADKIAAETNGSGSEVEDWLDALHRDFPGVAEVSVLRADIARSVLPGAQRRRVHRLLGRQMAAARLGALADAPVELLLASAVDERRAWERESVVEAGLRDVLITSLRRLERSLSDRLSLETS